MQLEIVTTKRGNVSNASIIQQAFTVRNVYLDIMEMHCRIARKTDVSCASVIHRALWNLKTEELRLAIN